METRYYDGATGRFLSEDSVFLEVGGSKFKNEVKGSIYVKSTHGQRNQSNQWSNKSKENNNEELEAYLSNPQFLNSYSYTVNNPLRYNDKNGKATFELSLGFTAGPVGLNVGVRIDPKNGWQIYSSNSIGLGFGFSVKYDSKGELMSVRLRSFIDLLLMFFDKSGLLHILN